MSKLPLWVHSPSIQGLLNLLVDRLDGAEVRGSQKTQSVALTEKTWPALYLAPVESEKEALWAQLLQLRQWGWLQVRPAAAGDSGFGYAESPRITVLDAVAVRQAVGRPERIRSPMERWRDAIERCLDAPTAVKKIAGDYCIDMADHSMDEVVTRLNELKLLAGKPLLLREVSARLFWGMSKVLDSRQGLVAALLENDECPFPESPIQLQVYLPAGGFTDMLFIENQMSFEQAIRSETGVFAGLALVYASGFKSSAQRLRKRGSASIYYSHMGALGGATKEAFERALLDTGSDVPVHFWGDLDWSGMRILAAMRGTFLALGAWQAGYGPMLASLVAGQGHSPEAAEKQGQRPLNSTGCAYADKQLLPELQAQGLFIDQELFAF